MLETSITWIIAIFLFFYLISRFWKDISFNWKLKRLIRYELNDVLTNDKYKVKGKNE